MSREPFETMPDVMDAKQIATAWHLRENIPDVAARRMMTNKGGLTFEIEKGRLSFRLTAPYSEERKQAASKWAKKNGIQTL